MAVTSHPAFDDFVRTVAQLRDPQTGCPWNRTQTHGSLGDYLIEEAYEALDAIESGDPDHLREELGDVLLQVVLHAQIAEEAGDFTIEDVCRTIDDKMIRRHPHVFSDAVASNANEVSDLWEQVKLAEKADEDAQEKSLLDDVPTHFPALLQAQKISRRAAAAGFEWETLSDVWDKVDEERAELEEAYALAPKSADGRLLAPDHGATEEEGLGCDPEGAMEVANAEMEFGDLLFSLVNVARRMGIDAESALRASNAKFRRRFRSLEEECERRGYSLEDLPADKMEEIWQQVKKAE